MSTVIEVENISKSYLINHQQPLQYRSLRDEITQGVRRITQSLSARTQDHDERREIFWALKGVTFSIHAGERVGIIGSNGAGKSTLLKILSRVTKPTTGRIRIIGRLGSLLEVGTGFHPELTGRENIFLNGAILGMTRQEVKKKFPDIVEFAEIERFLDTPVKRYSSGMYVRLAFSIAAHFEPDLLILDEVLAVGDQKFQKKCFDRIQQMGKESGRAVVIVSHNMTAISEICTRCLFIDKGQIAHNSIVSDTIQNYISEKSIQSQCGDIVKLEQWKNREGPADLAVLRWVQIDTTDQQKQIHIGSNIIIRFCVFFPEKIDANKLSFAVLIHNILGAQIANMVDMDSKFKPGLLENDCIFELSLKDIRFYPGKYTLSFWIGNQSHPVDYVKECLQFKINEGGDYVSRILPTNTVMNFLTPSWQVHT
jgi:lipopolysaccharide transport system ATP-binding protein